MNVEISTKAAQFLFLEYINGIFVAVCHVKFFYFFSPISSTFFYTAYRRLKKVVFPSSVFVSGSVYSKNPQSGTVFY
jgi:hypothetical protein